MSPLALSVLDLLPVRTGQTTADAVSAARGLARIADEAGYRRYWVAEHHNMPSVASTNPPVLISLLAAATERIRVGSGGVMLPNHAPLVVAEQFALLEAAYPGRIDLGIGRAPGADPVTAWALRAGADGQQPVERFPEHVEQVRAMLEGAGLAGHLGGRRFTLTATPHAVAAPPVWLLGSSDYSARLAAQLGLPYVFAHHFSGHGVDQALELYRTGFRGEGEPRTFLTANVVVADTEEESDRLALPFQHMMGRLRTNLPPIALPTVEEAEALELPLPPTAFRAVRESWFVGTADVVADRLVAFADRYGVDEVMVQPVAGDQAADPLDRTPARERTLRRLAAAVGARG
ncbi:luciferase family oxidoreductase, group 1 [Raineyella antarctica]|uniref:Luciferase family oxidoreductase, group 1 n=1 Tax=Raineyella antarctica TaxID=1577474 RepID=A0A1G6GDE1_9ACTN|nr:LLM class flavin-dependent oxidoreductase [Raineyella antarctica]SDB80018.1 luciferase family oxidoreductase, group 1 [Raineyella antarctica]